MKKLLLLVILAGVLVIRVWDLGNVPNGFSWDEMDNVYQAYSLLKTGKDLFGNPLPVLLHSFADYKSSAYIYMTIPFVAIGGMTVVTSKVAAVLFGFISMLAMVVISSRIFKNLKLGLISGIIIGISPWWFSYSRLSFEAVGMMAFFLVGLALWPKKQYLSILMFALSVWTYSTAKLFVPLFLLLLLLLNWKSLTLKKIILLSSLFVILVLPVQIQSIFGKGGTRFNEISIFTDPTTATEVNYALEQGQVSSGIKKVVGLNPRLVDRLAHNKLEFWGRRLINNYLLSFSSDFLFLKGDPNLRHSPGRNVIGQLYPTDAIFIIAGLIWLFKSKNWLIGLMLILAPLPSVLTRDGGSHATRLLFMLPPLVILITAGIRQLNKIALWGVIAIHLYLVFSFGYFYFSHYRFESLKPFQWGFDRAVESALAHKNSYANIVFDYNSDSALMSYLVTSKYDPSLLQNNHPLISQEIVPGYSGLKFENITLLPPGSRPWSDFEIPNSTLLVLSGDQPTPKSPNWQILYPDDTVAFNFFVY